MKNKKRDDEIFNTFLLSTFILILTVFTGRINRLEYKILRSFLAKE